MNSKDFVRRVGFGLRPDEEMPSDPLAWAKMQMTSVPDLIWPNKMLSAQEMLAMYRGHADEIERIESKIKDKAKQTKQSKEASLKFGLRFWEGYELAIRHYQAVQGDAPVFERFWHFWGNHFAIIDTGDLAEFCTGPMQREHLRPRLTGKISDMVYEMTLSWPMLNSLDNNSNVGPNSKYNRRARQKGSKVRSINENHARELLELHTLSPDADYTQDDILNAAYIMTGWGFSKEKTKVRHNVVFDEKRHEPGTHVVMGKSFEPQGLSTKTNGNGQLRALVEFLCNHEQCRKFIAWKLCRHFICDEPTDEMISVVTDAWEASDGSLIDIHHGVLDAAWQFGSQNRKFLTPETWLLQAVRMIGSDWPGVPADYNYNFKDEVTRKQNKVTRILGELGHRPYRASQPNGFPDTQQEWLSPEYLARRLALANDPSLLSSRLSGVDYFNLANNVIVKNFDNPDAMLAQQEHLKAGGEYGTKRYLYAVLMSERMLKI